MHQQINECFESLLSKFQWGFRQGFCAQQCLSVMVEKMKKIRDDKGVLAAVLTGLSKGFDWIPHGLLIAKLCAFGFDKKRCPFFLPISITENKKTKVGSKFSDFRNILFGVAQ